MIHDDLGCIFHLMALLLTLRSLKLLSVRKLRIGRNGCILGLIDLSALSSVLGTIQRSLLEKHLHSLF